MKRPVANLCPACRTFGSLRPSPPRRWESWLLPMVGAAVYSCDSCGRRWRKRVVEAPKPRQIPPPTAAEEREQFLPAADSRSFEDLIREMRESEGRLLEGTSEEIRR